MLLYLPYFSQVLSYQSNPDTVVPYRPSAPIRLYNPPALLDQVSKASLVSTLHVLQVTLLYLLFTEPIFISFLRLSVHTA